MTGTDLGIFAHSVWTTLFEGQFFFNTIEFLSHHGVTSHFGVHVSPVLVLLLPAYAVYQGPETLLVYQSLLLGLGAVPLYITAKKMLGNPGAVVISLAYFLYPALHGVNFSNFHEIAFLPLFLGFFLYGWLFQNNKIILLFGLLCLFIKEDISLIIIAACLVRLWIDRNRDEKEKRVYILLLLIAVIWLILAFTTIMPAFTPEHETISTTFLTQYYGFESTLVPDFFPRIQYIFLIFFPLLFLPVISPEILLIAIPSFFEILLSPSYFNLEYQYSALVIPPLFFATILSLYKIRSRGNQKNWYPMILLFLLMSSLLSCALVSPIIPTILERGEHGELRADSDWFKEGVSLIPSHASVSTQANLVSFFTNRPSIFPEYVKDVEYIVIWEKFTDSQVYKDQIASIARTYQYIYKKNGLFIFKKKDLDPINAPTG